MAVNDELCQTQDLTTQVERIAETRLLPLLHITKPTQLQYINMYLQ